MKLISRSTVNAFTLITHRTTLILGLYLAVGATLLSAAGLSAPESPRRIVSFDRGWKFFLGEAPGAEQPGFDDHSWRPLDLPHDWSIEGAPNPDPKKKTQAEGPFDKNSPAGAAGGYLNGGTGWYRKTFAAPLGEGERVSIRFDGAYQNSHVWINGHDLGLRPYGFSSFEYELTPFLKGNAPNLLAVQIGATQPSCRWYSGAGIYRHVWLITNGSIHFVPGTTFITTPQVTAATATVHVATQIENQGGRALRTQIYTRIFDPAGIVVAEATTELPGPILAEATRAVAQDLTISTPHRWSTVDPALYRVESELRAHHAAANLAPEILDRETTRIGLRTAEFTSDRGFLLNGARVQIQGVCNHHDLGCLGAAGHRRALQRQIEILKGCGVNALRTSHNPPAPELLDLCDEMGILVMDEAFDEWKLNHKKYGYAESFDRWSEADLAGMIRRDRNHPSVILYSIGNEIEEGRKGLPVAGVLAQRLVEISHREDPTRLVTSACPSPENAWKSGLAKALDLFGVNYSLGWYARNAPGAKPPADPAAYRGSLPLLGSETSSQVDSRGEYGLHLDEKGSVQIEAKPGFQVSSYDLWHPSWGCSAETDLLALKNAPWVAGEFVWTGFDYLGEPTPFSWPARSSYFGLVDLAGFPKDRYYIYQSQWTTAPMVHLLPMSWSWPGLEGKAIEVRAFTNCDSVELFLNDRSLGLKRVADGYAEQTLLKQKKGEPDRMEHAPGLHLAWSVPYTPGVLRAVARRGDTSVAEDVLRTAGPPAQIQLTVDRASIAGDGEDLAFIKVAILDAQGTLCPDAAPKLTFALDGPAAIVAGLDNGDATNHEPFQGTQHTAYHGLALVVLRSVLAQGGVVNLTATTPGLPDARVAVTVIKETP